MMTTSGLNATANEHNLLARLRRWWLSFAGSVSYQRLSYKLPITHAEFAVRQAESSAAASSSPPWTSSVEKLLERTQKALDNNESELGWHCLNAALRLQLYGLKPDRLAARAQAILREACDENKAISVWRKKAILNLLADKEGKLNASVETEQVVEAARLLDEHMDNMYQKLTIARSNLRNLSVIGAATLTFWFLLSPPPGQLAVLSKGDTVNINLFWVSIILAGIVGALVSGFTSSIRPTRKDRIPMELAASAITYARITLGALSALAISLFLSSGLINLGELNYERVLVLAFVAGFSDRFLLGAIEAMVKPGDEAKP